jgi:polyphosphate kinase
MSAVQNKILSDKKVPLINRDISWLSFNARVLQEAEDETVPLIERIRFLGIFSNNRDEFFRVRVATIRRMTKFGKKAKNLLGADPDELLEEIQKIVISQQEKFERVYQHILKELAKENIFIINEKQLTEEEGKFVRDYFHDNVFPFLVPVMVDTAPKFPYLKDKSSYLAIRLGKGGKDRKFKYSVIELPTDIVSRFLVLPAEESKKKIILLDDVIRYCLNDVFSIFEYKEFEAYQIKITRDAELDIDSDVSKGLMEKISKGVKQRKKGQPVRFAYDEKIPADLLNFIIKKVKLDKEESLIPGGRYHNFKDFINFPNVGRPGLRYHIPHTLEHPRLKGEVSLFKVIREKDVLLSYPYQSFHHINDLLREASIDPKVQSIKISLYRAAKNSGIVNALINAVKNGKQVTAVLELQARFDEEANIYFANKLQEEGAKVIFGVPGLKVHSKVFVITRKEGGKLVSYAHIGTGNFNEQTAKVYCDHSLLTADRRITDEVVKLFNFYQDNFKIGTFKHLVVAPFNMREKFIKLINKEINNAKEGKPAYMILKMNNLVDIEMIKKLYKASEEGVQIRLCVRGTCAIVPGIKGVSENIEVISIVDKFLEHSRIFVFANGGDEKYFISSGDWMYRNLDHRSEVAVPIFDREIQQQLKHYLKLQFEDNSKARMMHERLDNKYVHRANGKTYRAQDDIYRWLLSEKNEKKNKPDGLSVLPGGINTGINLN